MGRNAAALAMRFSSIGAGLSGELSYRPSYISSKTVSQCKSGAGLYGKRPFEKSLSMVIRNRINVENTWSIVGGCCMHRLV